MKSYFNLYIICIISLFTLGSSISKQETSIPDVDAYAKRVFEILISQDSVAYKNELEITDRELNDLVYQYVKGDSLRQKNQGLTFEQALEQELTKGREEITSKKKVFFGLINEFREKGIDVQKCGYLYSTFKIQNERNAPNLIMGKINIVFNYEGKKHAVMIRESIVVNNKWKIISIKDYIELIDRPQIEATVVDSVAVVPADTTVAVPAEYSKTQNSKAKKISTPKKKVVKK